MAVQSGEISLPVSRSETSQSKIGSTIVQVEIIDASQLCGDIANRWELLRANNHSLTSPYMDVQFTKAVANVRDDVEIAILKNEVEEIVGFLPFQRISDFHAEPVGGRLNDVHGLVSLDTTRQSESIQRVMKAAKLKSFGFHALNSAGFDKEDSGLKKFVFTELDSHFIDLRAGWPAYQDWSKKNSKTIKRQGQKTRSLIRDVGPLKFEFDCANAEVLEQLIELKRSKYTRSKTFDILSVDWAANLLREISTIETPNFQGLLSVLFAGDELVAVHFGMLTDDVLHYWFPVFDPAFSRYSPGTELILSVAEEAAKRGVNKVDFGYGDDLYKFKFCNGRESVCCGKVTTKELSFQIAKRRYQLRQKLKAIPMKKAAKSLLRKVFPGFGQWNFK